MKADIHPKYKEIKVTCSCGNTFVTRSTMEKDKLSLEICANCHPFYTGTQKMIDTAGRVDRFRQKYGMKAQEAKEAHPPAAKTKEAHPAAKTKEAHPAAKAKETKSAGKAKETKSADDKQK